MNFASFIVLCIILLWIYFAIAHLKKDKRQGKSACGGQCASCGLCHQAEHLYDRYQKQKLSR